MLTGAIESIKGAFGRVFVVGLFLPVLAILGLSLAVGLEAAWDLRTAVSAAAKLPVFTQGLLVAASVTLAAFVAVLLGNLQYGITRLFEGYWTWGPPARWLARRRSNGHLRRLQRLEDRRRRAAEDDRQSEAASLEAAQHAAYPPLKHANRIMPTRLGNILRASELYPFDRYGMDSVVIWPRLWPLLPAEQAARVEEHKLSLDLMLLLSLLLGLFALVWCPVLAVTTNRWDLVLFCAAAWPLAWLIYLNALQAARAYAEQVNATFDLYRFALIDAIGLTQPTDGASERSLWDDLVQFYLRNLPLERERVSRPLPDAESA